MKKAKVIQPQIKIGGGSFLLSSILAFESKQAFIDAYSHLNCSKDMTAYLTAIWDEAHKADDLKVRKTKVNEQEAKSDDDNPVVDAVDVVKMPHKRKSESKKE